jgi:hypothetical protein
MGNNVRPLVPATLKYAERLAREFFDSPLAKHGLIGRHEYLDHTNYFIVPEAGGLELLWYYDMFNKTPRAVLELRIDQDTFSRLTWGSGRGWLYSMMGGESENRIEPRGEEFLHAVNQLLATDFTVGIEYPVKKDHVADIVEFYAQCLLTAKGVYT